MSQPRKISKRADERRKRRRALASEQAIFEKLGEVRSEREPFLALNRRILADVLGQFAPTGLGPVLEVGAGDGQLHAWLPEALRSRSILTEPTARGVREIERQNLGVPVVRAGCERLPFAEGTVALALGLCVFDVLPDLSAAVVELGRALCPGARVIHVLDQNPFLKPLFVRLMPLGLVLLPNVLGDPSAAHWPEDILCVEIGQLEAILEVLRRHRHPVAEPLGGYLDVFRAGTPAVERALIEFDELSRNPRFREVLAQGLRAAHRVETGTLGEFRGHLLSSSQELAHRLQSAFSGSGLFEVELCDIVASAETVAEEGLPRYSSVCCGQHRSLSELPEHSLTGLSTLPPSGQSVREAGVLVFVARRSSTGQHQ